MKVRAIARGLVLRGHRVTVLTTDLGLREQGEGLAFSCSPWGWRSTTDDVEALYLQPRGLYRSLTWNPAVHGFSQRASALVRSRAHLRPLRPAGAAGRARLSQPRNSLYRRANRDVPAHRSQHCAEARISTSIW